MSLKLDTALIKTASRCNYDCSYCYVYQGKDTSWRDQPKRMGIDVIKAVSEKLIQQSFQQDAGFAIVLHGGEPLMLGYDGIYQLISSLRSNLDEKRYPISIQTNGSLITTKLLNLFSDFRVSVSVSIDGPKVANDLGRIDLRGKSTFLRTVCGIEYLMTHPDKDFLFAGTLTVIQPSTSATNTYEFLKSIGSPNMDFLMQDGNHDQLPIGKESFYSTEYGNWISDLFYCYVTDPSPVPIRFFDDIIRLLLGGESTKEGRGIEPYGILIIETDGEIRKNDTLRSSFDGADLFINRWNISNTKISSVLNSQEFFEYSNMQVPISSTCSSCDYFSVCGGGMPLYRWGEKHGYNAPSIYCKDHMRIIDVVTNRLKNEGIL